MITAERLRELLDYDEQTGLFRWRVPRMGGKKNRVGGQDWKTSSLCYIRIRIDGKLYYAHNLAWFYVHGVWPKMIDHIDRDGTNNRIANLRLTTGAANQFNRSSTKGVSIIYLKSGAKRWQVQVGNRWRTRYVGLFSTEEEALTARWKAVEERILEEVVS